MSIGRLVGSFWRVSGQEVALLSAQFGYWGVEFGYDQKIIPYVLSYFLQFNLNGHIIEGWTGTLLEIHGCNSSILRYFWASLITSIKKILHFSELEKKLITDLRSDRPNDGPTDGPSYGEDASKHIVLSAAIDFKVNFQVNVWIR